MGTRHLPFNIAVSQTRIIWLDIAVQAGSGFRSGEHCRSFRKKSDADKTRFYNIAQGSLEECRYYLILTRDLDYGDVTHSMAALEEVSRMLTAYIQRI